MDRLREIQQDWEQSLMRLSGDAQEATFIKHSPVSVYISKLQHFVDVHKAQQKSQNKTEPPKPGKNGIRGR